MANLFLHTGQWQGFYKYGPEYGRDIEGEEAEFRLFIEEINGTVFKGRIIDWDGFGAEGEVAVVNGFVDGHFVSFTKEYANALFFDDLGNTVTTEDQPGHIVQYQGQYFSTDHSFKGRWEITWNAGVREEGWPDEICSGTWKLLLQHAT